MTDCATLSKLVWDSARGEIDSALRQASDEQMGAGQFLQHLLKASMTQADVIGRVHRDSDGSNGRLVRSRSVFNERILISHSRILICYQES